MEGPFHAQKNQITQATFNSIYEYYHRLHGFDVSANHNVTFHVDSWEDTGLGVSVSDSWCIAIKNK